MALHYSSASANKAEDKTQQRDSTYMHDNFSNIINDAKPYRNIIKRYWTEEEVIFYNPFSPCELLIYLFIG
ncbi:MAG: hypothetical protein ACMG6E_07145 [Candidatus Roizmanbacteria bacterium]